MIFTLVQVVMNANIISEWNDVSQYAPIHMRPNYDLDNCITKRSKST